ncbi:MAG: hypothetical protein NTV22_04795 [bacterium]|nr:hypothetical protein [bacterium]
MINIHEQFASVKDAQASLTRIVKRAQEQGAFCRVMRNNKPIAALLPDDLFEQLLPLIRVAADAKARGVTPDWDSWLENWEAAHSPAFKKAMQAARADTRERTADEVFAERGV